jgi:hypothetical protein
MLTFFGIAFLFLHYFVVAPHVTVAPSAYCCAQGPLKYLDGGIEQIIMAQCPSIMIKTIAAPMW